MTEQPCPNRWPCHKLEDSFEWSLLQYISKWGLPLHFYSSVCLKMFSHLLFKDQTYPLNGIFFSSGNSVSCQHRGCFNKLVANIKALNLSLWVHWKRDNLRPLAHNSHTHFYLSLTAGKIFAESWCVCLKAKIFTRHTVGTVWNVTQEGKNFAEWTKDFFVSCCLLQRRQRISGILIIVWLSLI